MPIAPVTHSKLAVLKTLIEVQLAPPILTFVVPPTINPLAPLIVTVVPPPAGPFAGEIVYDCQPLWF